MGREWENSENTDASLGLSSSQESTDNGTLNLALYSAFHVKNREGLVDQVM